MEHLVPILTDLVHVIKTVVQGSDCMSDMDTIYLVGDIFENFASLATYFTGFDLEFDRSRKPTHYTQSQIEEMQNQYYAEHYPQIEAPVSDDTFLF